MMAPTLDALEGLGGTATRAELDAAVVARMGARPGPARRPDQRVRPAPLEGLRGLGLAGSLRRSARARGVGPRPPLDPRPRFSRRRRLPPSTSRTSRSARPLAASASLPVRRRVPRSSRASTPTSSATSSTTRTDLSPSTPAAPRGCQSAGRCERRRSRRPRRAAARRRPGSPPPAPGRRRPRRRARRAATTGRGRPAPTAPAASATTRPGVERVRSVRNSSSGVASADCPPAVDADVPGRAVGHGRSTTPGRRSVGRRGGDPGRDVGERPRGPGDDRAEPRRGVEGVEPHAGAVRAGHVGAHVDLAERLRGRDGREVASGDHHAQLAHLERAPARPMPIRRTRRAARPAGGGAATASTGTRPVAPHDRAPRWPMTTGRRTGGPGRRGRGAPAPDRIDGGHAGRSGIARRQPERPRDPRARLAATSR